MNYEEMSDFEINYMALELAVNSGIANNVSEIFEVGFTSKVLFKNPVGHSCRWDGCNNPSDAWPIVVENEINIEFQDGGFVNAWVDNDHGFFESQIQKNPLRAAMICFLKMKEGKRG